MPWTASLSTERRSTSPVSLSHKAAARAHPRHEAADHAGSPSDPEQGSCWFCGECGGRRLLAGHILGSGSSAAGRRRADARSIAIAALDIPTVIFPLQYAPLFDARRLGTITYRGLLIATGEAKPRGGEEKLAACAIIEARGGADPAALAAVRKHIAMVKSALDRIRNAFAMHGASAGLDNVSELVGKIQAFVDPVEAATAPPKRRKSG